MKLLQQIAKILFFIGLGCFIIAVLEGELQVGIVLFIPFIIGSGLWSVFGFFCFFLSFILYVLGAISDDKMYDNKLDNFVKNNSDQSIKNKSNSSLKTRGIILLGPIPIFIGVNRKVAIIYIIIFLFFLWLFFLSFFEILLI